MKHHVERVIFFFFFSSILYVAQEIDFDDMKSSSDLHAFQSKSNQKKLIDYPQSQMLFKEEEKEIEVEKVTQTRK